MATQTDGPCKAFIAGAAIEEYALVKLSSGKLAAAAVSEEYIGQLWAPALADLDIVNVRLRSAGGTTKCVAAGAFAVGAVVYGRDAGRVDDVSTSSALRVGIALSAATDAGDVVEVLPD